MRFFRNEFVKVETQFLRKWWSISLGRKKWYPENKLSSKGISKWLRHFLIPVPNSALSVPTCRCNLTFKNKNFSNYLPNEEEVEVKTNYKLSVLAMFTEKLIGQFCCVPHMYIHVAVQDYKNISALLRSWYKNIGFMGRTLDFAYWISMALKNTYWLCH